MKNRNILALLLVVALVMGLCACGTKPADPAPAQQETNQSETQTPVPEAPKDPVVLHWYTRGPGMQNDTAKVNAAFNELLHTYEGFENVDVVFDPFTGKDYPNAVTLAQTSGEPIDILCTVGLIYPDQVRNGALIGLNDLLESHPNLKNELPEWLWKTQIVDGDIYAIPNYQRGVNPTFSYIPDEYADCIDWDAYCACVKIDPKTGVMSGSIRELADILEEYLLNVREKTGSNTKYLDSIGRFVINKCNYRIEEYIDGASVSASSTVSVNPYDPNHVLESVFTSDAFKEAWQIDCEWHDKGYFPEDILTVDTPEFTGDKMMNDVSMVWSFSTSTAPNEEDSVGFYSDIWGYDVKVCFASDVNFMENKWAACGNGITSTCENPEIAMNLLELINTEAGFDLYNMLVYGLEGEHYEKIDDTHIKTLHYDGSQAGSDAPYSAHKWCVGNTFHAYLNQGCSDYENVWALEINNNYFTAPWAGLVLDTTDVGDYISQLKSVETEYQLRTCWGIDGAAGFEAAYNELMNKLQAVGLDKVIATEQAQLDAYIG